MKLEKGFYRKAHFRIAKVYASDSKDLEQNWKDIVRRCTNNEEELEIENFKFDTDNFLYFKADAIKGCADDEDKINTENVNGNGDAFPYSEIKASYDTFIGRGFYIEHKSDDVENAKGIILDAEADDKKQIVTCLVAISKNDQPELCRKIKSGKLNKVSMGCLAEKAECSICNNLATNENELCPHMDPNSPSYVKGKKIASGEMAYEINYGLTFAELSGVADPAWKDADMFNIKGHIKEALANHFVQYREAKEKAEEKIKDEESKIQEKLNQLENEIKTIKDNLKDNQDEEHEEEEAEIIQKLEEYINKLKNIEKKEQVEEIKEDTNENDKDSESEKEKEDSEPKLVNIEEELEKSSDKSNSIDIDNLNKVQDKIEDARRTIVQEGKKLPGVKDLLDSDPEDISQEKLDKIKKIVDHLGEAQMVLTELTDIDIKNASQEYKEIDFEKQSSKNIDEEFVKEFFKQRFGRNPKYDKSYFEKWKDRILYSEDPYAQMDSKSREVFDKLKKEKNIESSQEYKEIDFEKEFKTDSKNQKESWLTDNQKEDQQNEEPEEEEETGDEEDIEEEEEEKEE